MSLGETGALRAPAISWAFWLTLPPRARIFLTASVMLFCRPWPWPRAGVPVGPHLTPRAELSFRGVHRSPLGSAELPFE